MNLLENKVAIVTGGSRGIGAAIAKLFAANGASVAFTYHSSEEKAKALENELNQHGQSKSYKSDAADFAQCETLVNEVVKDFGQIDILVNNAGISKDNLLLRLSEEQWKEVINTNLNSVFNMTKQVIKPMVRARKGSIINMSSIVGIKGNAGQASYAASKSGIIGFTKSVAAELGRRNIRCNAIAPGFIETDMTQYLKEGNAADDFLKSIPLGRLGKSEEVADVALFLASELSSYITGQVISICGGLNM